MHSKLAFVTAALFTLTFAMPAPLRIPLPPHDIPHDVTHIPHDIPHAIPHILRPPALPISGLPHIQPHGTSKYICASGADPVCCTGSFVGQGPIVAGTGCAARASQNCLATEVLCCLNVADSAASSVGAPCVSAIPV
ncbi:hypothetical protein BDP27DRAFT_1431612 [Rhodocollybia butyracea]|uniref:Hydrophobin n=1 Tax=Rhodocollybia butyracea TaxID=206335 RepID=A0A9P5P9C2_9AGAR|nr:hypothetical protein BDP27DRAFT_1431612 [Rhodocollybia butyracea]